MRFHGGAPYVLILMLWRALQKIDFACGVFVRIHNPEKNHLGHTFDACNYDEIVMDIIYLYIVNCENKIILFLRNNKFQW